MGLVEGIEYVGPPEGSTQFEPFYQLRVDLAHLGIGGEEYSNRFAEAAVLDRLCDRYGSQHLFRNEDETWWMLEGHESVRFASKPGEFRMWSSDRDSLAPVCEVIDVLLAEADGEPSFMDIYGMRFKDVPPEYKRFVGRVLRLARLRGLMAEERGGAKIIVGNEKALVRRSFDEVMGMDNVPEEPLVPPGGME